LINFVALAAPTVVRRAEPRISFSWVVPLPLA
jgi:hypothetical protein